MFASVDMIRPLAGQPSTIRAQAAQLRSMRTQLSTASASAARLDAITSGTSWTGPAYDAFAQSMGRKPVPEDLSNAITVMDRAAGSLERYAEALGIHQSTVWRCRSRLVALGVDGSVPAESEAEVRRLLDDADAARAAERDARRSLQDGFDLYDDQTIYATPPPSLGDRVGGFVSGLGHVAWEFGAGFVEGTVEMVVGVAKLAFYLNPIMMPYTAFKLWENREQVMAVVQYAIDDPAGFALEVGKAVVDWETFRESPARWLGKLGPEVVVAVLTAGSGSAATSASRAARGLRAVDTIADGVTLVRRADHVADVADAARTADRVADAATATRRLDDLPFSKRALELARPYVSKLTDELRSNPVDGMRNLLSDAPRGVELSVDAASNGVLATDGMRGLGRLGPRFVAANVARDTVTLGAYSRLKMLDRFINGFSEISTTHQVVLGGGTIARMADNLEPIPQQLIDLADEVDVSAAVSCEVAEP